MRNGIEDGVCCDTTKPYRTGSIVDAVSFTSRTSCGSSTTGDSVAVTDGVAARLNVGVQQR